MLGGRGDSLDKTREFSEIELLIIERILVISINLLQEPWQNVLDISPHLERIETNSQYAQIISPSEVIAIITMNIKIGDVVELKKQHACGCKEFEITRVGMDIKIKCTKCLRSIMLDRETVEKKIKKIIKK